MAEPGWCPIGATHRRCIAVIDAYLQVLATDPTRAAIIFVATTVAVAFVLSGALAALASLERRLALIFRRRPRPLPLHGPVRPFMRKVLEFRDHEDAGMPDVRPRPYRLLLAIVVVVAIVASTGYRMVGNLPPLPFGATVTPTPVVPLPTPVAPITEMEGSGPAPEAPAPEAPASKAPAQEAPASKAPAP